MDLGFMAQRRLRIVGYLDTMRKPQFEIKSLLVATALIAAGLTFATQTGGWIVGLLVTILLATFLSASLALFYYVAIPMLEARKGSDSNSVD
ncbi:MAG: hypothetical protein ACI87E_005087 [Mariniblastus sp.]|jgi:hypothetical protein